MMDKLLPCPFCGGEAIVVKTEHCGRYIGCWDCGGRTEEFETDYAGSAHDKAIAAWNRRAGQDHSGDANEMVAQPENKPLTCEGCECRCEYENEAEYGYPSPCTACQRRAADNYRYKAGGGAGMNADEIVRGLRESCTGNELAPPMVTNRELTEAADLIESLQARLVEYDALAAEYGIDGKTMLTLAKSQIRTAQDNIKLREQLGASQRREQVAVEILKKIAEYNGSLTCHCNDILKIVNEWRGPQEAEKALEREAQHE